MQECGELASVTAASLPGKPMSTSLGHHVRLRRETQRTCASPRETQKKSSKIVDALWGRLHTDIERAEAGRGKTGECVFMDRTLVTDGTAIVAAT